MCGGLGTRLREETEFLPKPMINIGERPILWHIMKIYAHYGYKDFILNLGYKGNIIREYFFNYKIMNNDIVFKLGDPNNFLIYNNTNEDDWLVTLANTGEKTLKGARLKKVEKYIDDDTFMMTYGDGLADININNLLKFHHSHGKIATITGVNPTSRFGEMKIEGNTIKIFDEKPNTSSFIINGGFCVFNKKIFDYISDNEYCDLEKGVFEKLASEGELMVYKHEGMWACMDTPRDMDYLNDLWNKNKAFWKVWR